MGSIDCAFSLARQAQSFRLEIKRERCLGGRMRRRDLMTFIIGGAVAWPVAARAQQPIGKVARIGYLGAGSASEAARGATAFETGFRDLGYIKANPT